MGTGEPRTQRLRLVGLLAAAGNFETLTGRSFPNNAGLTPVFFRAHRLEKNTDEDTMAVALRHGADLPAFADELRRREIPVTAPPEPVSAYTVLFGHGRKREHPQPNFSTLLAQTSQVLDSINALLTVHSDRLARSERFELTVRESELRASSSTVPLSVLQSLIATGRSDWADEIARASSDDGLRAGTLASIATTRADSSIAVEALDTARSIANDRSAARCCRRSPLLWPAATLTEPRHRPRHPRRRVPCAYVGVDRRRRG